MPLITAALRDMHSMHPPLMNYLQLCTLSKILSLVIYFYYIQLRHIFKINLKIKKENKYPPKGPTCRQGYLS